MNYKKIRNDSYSNVMSGLGDDSKDKNRNLRIVAAGVLEDEQLSNIYVSDGLGTVIIDAPAEDATKNGWILLNDEDEKIAKELKRLKFKQIVTKALKYTRLYRGCIIAMVTERGKISEELPKNPGMITELKVYSAARMDIQTTDFIDDEDSEDYDEPEVYRVRALNGTPVEIHRSRCLIFKGELIPDDTITDFELTNQYWGLSVFQRTHTRLKYYGATEQGISNLMQELGLGVYSLENLAQILAMNREDALKKIKTRLEAINASKSTINSVIIGANEKFERIDANLSNVGDVMDRFMMGLSGVSKIPVTKLFGRSAAGMNATGEGDLSNYYDMIRTIQEDMQPELDKCIQVVGQYISGGNRENYGIDEYVSLWEPTEKEKAETDKLKAETYQIYYNMLVLGGEDIINKEFPDLLNEYKKRENERAEQLQKQI